MLRAIALKQDVTVLNKGLREAEIIMLRAIALKQNNGVIVRSTKLSRDHNATSYSTETTVWSGTIGRSSAEIIMLRAIALKR